MDYIVLFWSGCEPTYVHCALVLTIRQGFVLWSLIHTGRGLLNK